FDDGHRAGLSFSSRGRAPPILAMHGRARSRRTRHRITIIAGALSCKGAATDYGRAQHQTRTSARDEADHRGVYHTSSQLLTAVRQLHLGFKMILEDALRLSHGENRGSSPLGSANFAIKPLISKESSLVFATSMCFGLPLWLVDCR